MGESTWTKRDKNTGRSMDQKKAPAKKKFKGVRREKAGCSGKSQAAAERSAANRECGTRLT